MKEIIKSNENTEIIYLRKKVYYITYLLEEYKDSIIKYKDEYKV